MRRAVVAIWIRIASNLCQLRAGVQLPTDGRGTGTANYILIRLSKQVSIPIYRFIHFLEHETRCGGCMNKNCLICISYVKKCNFRPTVGNGTANHILIRLSVQESIPLYQFIYFLEHETRCGGYTNKNCFNSRHFQNVSHIDWTSQ